VGEDRERDRLPRRWKPQSDPHEQIGPWARTDYLDPWRAWARIESEGRDLGRVSGDCRREESGSRARPLWNREYRWVRSPTRELPAGGGGVAPSMDDGAAEIGMSRMSHTWRARAAIWGVVAGYS
jgi:hypothetical protein